MGFKDDVETKHAMMYVKLKLKKKRNKKAASFCCQAAINEFFCLLG